MVESASEHREEMTEAVGFIGETLGPLFLYDPADPQVAALYDSLRSLDVAAASQEWPFADPDSAAQGLSLLVEGLRASAFEDIIWEYRRLFVGPAAKAAPPWGSVYTDKECVIFGESTLKLREWLRRSGVSFAGAASNEPEDHIGAMLLLMAWTARHRPELLVEYLQQHLLPWAPHFLDIVQAETTQPAFEGLALLTKRSLAGIQQALEISVDPPRFYR